MTNIDFRLYLITDRTQSSIDLFDAVEQALKGGVKAVQVREKDLSIRELTRIAFTLRELTRNYKAKLFINDRVDVALSVHADGVHLGHESLPVDAVKKISKGSLSIGVSTHDIREALKAYQKGADFITLGPVFDTPSKRRYGDPLGLEVIKKVKDSLDIPVFAIGGVKLDNIYEVIDSGADGIALISGILSSDDIYGTTKDFINVINDRTN